MITIILKCRHCGSDQLARDGRAPNGKQRYWCKACQRSSRDNPQPNGYLPEEQERILRAYEQLRMTLSFSKCETIHEACLRLFLHRNNLSLYPL